MIRAKMKSAELVAPPASSALNRNRIAASIITLRRPIVSASRPATNAPTEEPTRIAPTLTPMPSLPSPNAASSPFWVPLITPLS